MTITTIVLASAVIFLMVVVAILSVMGWRKIKQIKENVDEIFRRNYTLRMDSDDKNDEIQESIRDLESRVFDANRKDSLYSVMEERINENLQYMEKGFKEGIISEMDRRLDKVHSKIKGLVGNLGQPLIDTEEVPEVKDELKNKIHEEIDNLLKKNPLKVIEFIKTTK